MGIAQSGIAFRVKTPIADMSATLSSVFDERAAEMPSPVAERFDIRNHSDVMVQLFGDVCFVSNDDLARPLLRDEQAVADRLHASLGGPDLLLAYCHDDDGGSHGYAVFERGQRRRTRLQTSGAADLPPLTESGAPLPFEQRWLRPGHYAALPAHDLTGRMLQDGLESMFGVCPWETLITPTYRFFRLGDSPASATAVAPVAPTKRPWWHLR